MNLTSADVLTWPSCSPALVQGRVVLDPVWVRPRRGRPTVIRRVLLLIYTDREDDADTESDIKLQIAASGQLLVWGSKWMSTRTSEGDPSVELVVTPGQGRR